MHQLLVAGGTIVSGGLRFTADLLAEDGIIRAVGTELRAPGAEVLDARGLLVLPGGVDVHVHLPWPTGSHISSDDIASGTLAALHGGTTTLIDFVIPGETQSLAEALDGKLQEASGAAWVDHAFHLNIRGDTASKIAEIPEMVRRGFPSFKVFMAYEGFRLKDDELRAVLRAAAAAGGMVSAHAEDGPLADAETARLLAGGQRGLEYYPQARPAACEESAVRRVLAFQAECGARLHVHHISTASGAELVGAARRAGRPVSGETCPHYLLFTAEDYRGNPAQAASLVCAPSIKSREDQDGLWRALQSGEISTLATDHCPYTRAQKEADLSDFSRVPGGMSGVETRLALVYSAGVPGGKLSLERLAQVWSEGPARAFGLFPRKGVLAPGSDADLVLFDPSQTWTLRAAELHSRSDCHPAEGWRVNGRPVATVLRGQVAVRGGQLAAGKPCGQLLRRTL